MSEPPPSVSVIIAARPDQAEIKAVPAAKQLDYPPDHLEIIVARGRQPSVQRNAALRTARGEWIYFLDDDSEAETSNLRHVSALLNDPAVKMLGGPNLCPSNSPLLERIFAVVLASWLAFGPSRARYSQIGIRRETSEKELILCNLMARRDALLELGGFNEALYPNEENALMDELQQCGGKLIYDPQFVVFRRPRRTLKSFAKMLMTYGRGRAEQFRVNPTFGSAINFIPPLFCVYLGSLPVIESVTFAPSLERLPDLYLAPLAIYLLAVVVQTLCSIPEHGTVRSLAAAPLLVVTHVLYGIGFWRGAFTRLCPSGHRDGVPVVLENIPR